MLLNFFKCYDDKRTIFHAPDEFEQVEITMRNIGVPSGTLYLYSDVSGYTHFFTEIEGLQWCFEVTGVEYQQNGKYIMTYEVDYLKTFTMQGGFSNSSLLCTRTTDDAIYNPLLPFDVNVTGYTVFNTVYPFPTDDKCICIVTQGTANTKISIGMNLSVIAFTSTEFDNLCKELFTYDYSKKVVSVIQNIFIAPVNLTGTVSEPLYFISDTGASVGTATTGHCITAFTEKTYNFALEDIRGTVRTFLNLQPMSSITGVVPFLGTVTIPLNTITDASVFRMVFDYLGGTVRGEVVTGSNVIAVTGAAPLPNYALTYKDRTDTVLGLYNSVARLAVPTPTNVAGAGIGAVGEVISASHQGIDTYNQIGGMSGFALNTIRFIKRYPVLDKSIDDYFSTVGGRANSFVNTLRAGHLYIFDVVNSKIKAHPMIYNRVLELLAGGIYG